VASKLQQLAAVLQGRVIRAVVMTAPPLAVSAATAAIVTRRVILAMTGEQQELAAIGGSDIGWHLVAGDAGTRFSREGEQ
jgi:hypothetical protein